MKFLIVRRPWVDEILDGSKTIEYRSRATSVRGRIGLVASGQPGQVLGTVDIVGCEEGVFSFEWQLAGAKRFAVPVAFKQPRGAVVWVNGAGDLRLEI